VRNPPRRKTVEPGSEIDRLLAEASDHDLLFERDGLLFRLSQDGGWEGREDLSNEEYQRILDETLGSWSDIDADKLISDIYRWREEGSRPIDRP
jgi:hypothetical protein